MPKLKDAILKVEESKRRKPKKRRPYLDSIPVPESYPREENQIREDIAEIPKRELDRALSNISPKIELTQSQKEIILERKTLSLPKENKECVSKQSVQSPIVNISEIVEEDGFDIENFRVEAYGELTQKFLFYIFHHVRKNGSLMTGKLKKLDLLRDLNIKYDSLRTVIKRLLKQKVIKKEGHQRGRFGWARYSMRKSVYDYMLNFTAESNVAPSHSGNSNSEDVSELDQPFDVVINESLKQVGLSLSHVSQLKRAGISNEKIQSSFDAFAHDIKQPDFYDKLRHPLGFIMKVIKSEGEYLSSRGYRSPEEEIMLEMIRLKKERVEQRKKMERDLIDLSFEEWLSEKSKNDVLKLVPNATGGEFLGTFHKSLVFEFFTDKIWPNKSTETNLQFN